MSQRGKKGISNVVSTVLLILVVVAAIAIISILVINLVKNLGKGSNVSAICQRLETTPIECVYNNTDTYSRFSVQPDGIKLVNLTMIYEKETGSAIFKTIIGTDLENLTTTSFLFDDSSNANNAPKTFSILSIILVDNALYTCPQSRKINCVVPNPSSNQILGNEPISVGSGGFITTPSSPSTGVRRGGSSSSTGPSGSSVNGVCGNITYTCLAGTVSNIDLNLTHYTWQCTGSGTGATSADCSTMRNYSSTTFNLTNPCSTYQLTTSSTCPVGGGSCYSTDHLTSDGNIITGSSVTSGITNMQLINGDYYLHSNWIIQNPQVVLGYGYVGWISLSCLQGVTGNARPIVSVSNPADGDVLNSNGPMPMPIDISASDPDGTIASIKTDITFYHTTDTSEIPWTMSNICNQNPNTQSTTLHCNWYWDQGMMNHYGIMNITVTDNLGAKEHVILNLGFYDETP